MTACTPLSFLSLPIYSPSPQSYIDTILSTCMTSHASFTTIFLLLFPYLLATLLPSTISSLRCCQRFCTFISLLNSHWLYCGLRTYLSLCSQPLFIFDDLHLYKPLATLCCSLASSRQIYLDLLTPISSNSAPAL